MEDEDLTPADVEHFRQRLLSRREELQAESDASEADRRPVTLDQQSVGRLSRMDALQQQAMAEALEVRRVQELRRIEAALLRMESGTFGECAHCGDLIVRKRLDLDPTTPHCIDCAAP